MQQPALTIFDLNLLESRVLAKVKQELSQVENKLDKLIEENERVTKRTNEMTLEIEQLSAKNEVITEQTNELEKKTRDLKRRTNKLGEQIIGVCESLSYTSSAVLV